MGDRHQSTHSRQGRPFFADRAGSGEVVSTMRKLIGGVLRLYKVAVSPFLPSACRYYPSCSEYMRQAVAKYGVARRVSMGVKRLSPFHPFPSGGLDPLR